MKKLDNQIIPKRRQSLLFLGVIVLFGIGATVQTSKAEGNSIEVGTRKLSFDKRLELYLDQKSRRFIAEMTLNEEVLIQFEKNIRKEAKRRGLSEIPLGSIDPQDYNRSDNSGSELLGEFSTELAQLLNLAKDLEDLVRLAEKHNDTESYEQLAALREYIFTILEESQAGPASKGVTSDMDPMSQDDYTRRNSALSLRIRLNKIANSSSHSLSDRQLLKEISKQVNSLNSAVRRSNDNHAHAIAKSYINEVGLLVDILEEIEKLNQDAKRRSLDVASEIESLRNTIVASLDNTLLSMVGYKASLATGGPTVSEVFYQWKAAEYTKYQLRFTRYKIQKVRLLRNATRQERDRMLAADLHSSFSNFISSQYSVAQRQFDLLLEEYGQDFRNVETVHYYRAESYYERQLYDAAAKDYAVIVADHSDSEYIGDSLYRLMYIHDLRGEKAKFSNYFQILKSYASRIDQDTANKCKYLAAYHKTKDGKYDEAQDILTEIRSNSRYFASANFLLGMVHVNKGNFANAIEAFKELVDPDKSASADAEISRIRNDALLKLGFIYYQQGDYEEASKYFDQVTANHVDRDQGMVASAWASFKVGNLSVSAEKVRSLLREEIVSDYAYEALVLSAHCKRIMNDDSALEDLRYVANARRVSELSHEYNKERREIASQLVYLDGLENQILENRDQRLYELTAELRGELELSLASFPYYGSSGTIVLDKFQGERQSIVKQIGELDAIVSKAYEMGDENNVKSANRQRERLMRSLDFYTADADMENVNSFLDYPQATKEGAERFRITMVRDIRIDLALEQRLLKEHLDQARSLLAYYKQYNLNDLTTHVELELIQQDLNVLDIQSQQLVVELDDQQVPEKHTEFDRWAEFSGFGMSDHTYSRYKAKEAEITQLAYNYNSITQFLQARKEELERKVLGIEKSVKELEFQMKRESLESQKVLRDDYFRESYFDTKERESGDQ